VYRARRLRPQHLDRVRVGIEIALGVRLGARALAQHVEGAQRQLRLRAGAGQRRIDGLADDEGMTERLHRLAQCGAHDGRDHGLGDACSGDLPGELGGHLGEQPPGGAEQREAGAQQDIRVAAHPRVANGGETLGDQLVGALRVRCAQQRLRQAHEGSALRAVERELLEHAVDERPRAPVGARRLNPARGTLAGASQGRLHRREVRDQLARGARLRAQRRLAQLRAQRREVARFASAAGGLRVGAHLTACPARRLPSARSTRDSRGAGPRCSCGRRRPCRCGAGHAAPAPARR